MCDCFWLFADVAQSCSMYVHFVQPVIIFIYTFFSLISLQVRPVDGFLRAIAQKT